jgi:hypothetical protein
LAHDPPVRGRGTIDYAAWGGATATGDTRELGGNGGYRRRAFEVALDKRRVHRATDPVDPHGYHSVASTFRKGPGRFRGEVCGRRSDLHRST